MIAERMKIEEVGDVDVFHTELIRLTTIMNVACLIIVYLNSLHFESNVSVFDSSIKLRVAIDEVDGGYVMSNKR